MTLLTCNFRNLPYSCPFFLGEPPYDVAMIEGLDQVDCERLTRIYSLGHERNEGAELMVAEVQP